MSSKFFSGYKEPIEQVSKIYVVSITDFIDKYKLEPKQRNQIIKNHLNNWLKNKISHTSNNVSNEIIQPVSGQLTNGL
jgi:hypothetical protein